MKGDDGGTSGTVTKTVTKDEGGPLSAGRGPKKGTRRLALYACAMYGQITGNIRRRLELKFLGE